MYRKILVAYNGTPESRLALDEAIRFAPMPRSKFTSPASFITLPPICSRENTCPKSRLPTSASMEADLKDAHALLAGNGLTVIDHLLVGEPVDVLTKLVAELGIDLLILGHPRSKSFALRWWRGSVDAVLIERVRCSVLVAADNPARRGR
jgi:nucleotide-binding universal stress UspA family protein